MKKAILLSSKIKEIKQANDEANVLNPSWNNGFLPGLDIIGIYTLLSEHKPKKYVEIGSGNSTKIAFKAKKENSPDTEIISKN